MKEFFEQLANIWELCLKESMLPAVETDQVGGHSRNRWRHETTLCCSSGMESMNDYSGQKCENSRQERIKNEPAVCGSLLGSAHTVAMTRIQWADQTGQGERVLANETVRPRSSLQFHV